ncbi:MAG: YihY/virulence factor BrkB family protein [Rickettsiales bacterium]
MQKIIKIIRYIIDLNTKAITNLINHDGVEHAGYMAFISLLSFFPFLIFIMSFSSFIGNSEYGKEVLSLLLDNMPAYLSSTLQNRVEEIVSGPPRGLLTLSIVGVIWTSSSALEGLRTILNKIYHVKTPPTYILRRSLSILQFFIITLIIVFSMFLLVFLPIIFQKISAISYFQPILEVKNLLQNNMLNPIWDNVRYLTFVITLFVSVMILYHMIPNVKLSVRSLIPGAILVSLGWICGGSLLSAYVYEFSQVNIVYGSLAGFIITLIFFYIIHIIFIYGAEVNYLLLQKKNKAI